MESSTKILDWFVLKNNCTNLFHLFGYIQLEYPMSIITKWSYFGDLITAFTNLELLVLLNGNCSGCTGLNTQIPTASLKLTTMRFDLIIITSQHM